jgi:glycosyltransferase involved in cell wall biosynthesis
MISVLMTAYNSQRFIANAMLSVFCQTDSDWELIIVDDASTDKTREKIDYMIGIHSKKIKVIKNKENLGHTKSMNIAMKAAQGDFLAKQDSDDISEIHRFEKQKIALQKYGLCTTYGIAINEDGSRINNSYTDKWQRESKLTIMRKLNTDCWFLLPSLMWRREVVNKIGYFDPLCLYAQDFCYLLRALKYFDITVIDSELYRFRKHSKSVRNSTRAKIKDWHQFAIKRAKECPKVD